MSIFRLIHVTDLHISVPPDPNDIGSTSTWMAYQAAFPSRARLPKLRAASDFLIANQGTADAILLSGDLADDGEQRNLEAALDFLEAEPESPTSSLTEDGFPTLANINRQRTQLFVVPGNHDRFDGLGRLPGGKYFDDVFSNYWTKGLGGVQSCTIHKADGSLALIAADFCLQTTAGIISPSHIWGNGSSNPTTLLGLEAETERLQNAGKGAAIVWVLHFPPFDHIEADLQLRSNSDVLNLADRLGVTHVIAGHLHRNQNVQYTNTAIYCTASATSDLRDRNGNWIQVFDFHLTDGKLRLAPQLYEYKSKEAAFLAP